MKCPKCQCELKITGNKYVQRSDGTLAYKLTLSCRNKDCTNYHKIVKTVYNPITVSEDTEEESAE